MYTSDNATQGTTIAVYASFDALSDACIEFFDTAAEGGIFSTLPWYRNLAKTVFSQKGSLRIYVISAAAEPQLPLWIIPMWGDDSVGPFGQRSLQQVGNFYTSLFSPLTSANTESKAVQLREWARGLVIEMPQWEQIKFSPLDPDSRSYDLINESLEAAGMLTQQYFCFGNWYLRVAGRSYDAYFSSLPSRLRNTVIRKSRQLESLPTFRMTILTASDQVKCAVAAFDRVVAASWKKPEPYPAFIPGLIATCAEKGWLRMGIAYLDEKPVAFQIWIVHRRIASIYKLAYDDAHAKLSIGTVLTAALMQHVIDEDKVVEVDYLTGDEPYKRDWMSDRRERWGIVGYNPGTARGLILAAKNKLGHEIKTAVRSVLHTAAKAGK